MRERLQPIVAEAPPEGSCSRLDPQLTLRVVGAQDHGAVDIEIGPDSSLDLIAANTVDAASEVRIAFSWDSQHGESHGSSPLLRVPAESEAQASLSVDDLGLPADRFDYSGNLMVWARASLGEAGDRGIEISPSIQLAFHSVDGGWRIYDPDTREREYSGGALSESARAERELALSRLPEGVRLAPPGMARLVASHDSADWLPPEDAPADPDHGGGQ